MAANNKSTLGWKITSIVCACALVCVSTLYALGVGWKDKSENGIEQPKSQSENTSETTAEATEVTDGETMLSLWTEGSDERRDNS